jgi:UDP-N-acetyl-D-galactosamine dehydrogenase
MEFNSKIAVIGLGYVGLPLARLFATRHAVVGFDINQSRVAELKSGIDTTKLIRLLCKRYWLKN